MYYKRVGKWNLINLTAPQFTMKMDGGSRSTNWRVELSRLLKKKMHLSRALKSQGLVGW
jgi:hypothetical protein